MPQEVTVSTYSDNDSIDGWAAVLHQLVDNPTALWTFNRVVVDDQDTPIAVSGGASIGHSENDTSSVATYSAAGAGGASVSWSVFGDDGGDFSISSAGVLTFKRPPDYENSADSDRDNVYRLMVHASNGRSTGMLLNVAVTVTDAVEKPLKPSAPSVSGTAASTTSLDVTWTAPDNTGRPAISGYDLQYRRGTSGGWTDGPQDVSGKRASIAGLDANSTYQVRVRASNADGDSPWSEAETRTKEAAGGDAPILVNAVVDRDLLTLTFNRELDGASVPAASDFEIRADGVRVGVDEVAVGGRSVTLGLVRTIAPGERITVSYVPSADPIRDESGTTATTFDAVPVTKAATRARLLVFQSASDILRQGFVRVINHSDVAGEVRIEAVDDGGVSADEVTLTVGAREAAHFNSDDLESGNVAKGLSGGVDVPSMGALRLEMWSELDIDALAYARTNDGVVTALHDWVPVEATVHDVAFFNSGSNLSQASRLWLVNPGAEDATVEITGIDDEGVSPGGAVSVAVPAGSALELTASGLESGTAENIDGGALGDGHGKWRLRVEADRPIAVMSLLESPTGHLSNVSTVPVTAGHESDSHVVALFPSMSDAAGRTGFVRVVNRSTVPGEVRIEAKDDANRFYEPLSLTLNASEAAQFNSYDLELGNPSKGLAAGTGPGDGDWWLKLSSELDIQVMAYIRMPDGFVTAMHDIAPTAGPKTYVAFFNPASNTSQMSRLRLVNTGAADAATTITGVDDTGNSPGNTVHVVVPAESARELTASELESGTGEGIDSGALGDGRGKWRLRVEADRPILVMSLLESPAGHLTNLSTSTRPSEP